MVKIKKRPWYLAIAAYLLGFVILFSVLAGVISVVALIAWIWTQSPFYIIGPIIVFLILLLIATIADNFFFEEIEEDEDEEKT